MSDIEIQTLKRAAETGTHDDFVKYVEALARAERYQQLVRVLDAYKDFEVEPVITESHMEPLVGAMEMRFTIEAYSGSLKLPPLVTRFIPCSLAVFTSRAANVPLVPQPIKLDTTKPQPQEAYIEEDFRVRGLHVGDFVHVVARIEVLPADNGQHMQWHPVLTLWTPTEADAARVKGSL